MTWPGETTGLGNLHQACANSRAAPAAAAESGCVRISPGICVRHALVIPAVVGTPLEGCGCSIEAHLFAPRWISLPSACVTHSRNLQKYRFCITSARGIRYQVSRAAGFLTLLSYSLACRGLVDVRDCAAVLPLSLSSNPEKKPH